MISSIQIAGYRGLEHLEMSGLGRVNLLVGTNNSGKTSVLEAIEILASKGDPISMWQILWRRGERIATTMPVAADPGRGQRVHIEADACHLFTGHDMRPGTKFSITAKNQTPHRSVTFEIVELSAKERAEAAAGIEDPTGGGSRLAIKIHGHPQPPNSRVLLSRSNGIVPESIDFGQRRGSRPASPNSQFVSTESLSGDQLIAAWGKVSLKPEEELVLEALRFLDSDIERIATITPAPYTFPPPSRGGFMVKKKSLEQPIPIGSMGDGMWRMLAMAISIATCKGGTLLVDEIDTGLHYTIMTAMWRLIYKAAKQFDVQVFATTHSGDCVYSLAQITDEGDSENPITVQRIETGRPQGVLFSDRELAIAASREIEVR
jgi:hypothetical protein